MKFTTLTAATLLAFTSLSTSQPLPDHATTKNVVPIRWNDVEAGIHAAQSSASASASVALHARGAAPAPAPASTLGKTKGKSGAEVGGHRGGSGLWGRSPELLPEPKKKKTKPEEKIEGVNVFDQGGDHKNDPSWG